MMIPDVPRSRDHRDQTRCRDPSLSHLPANTDVVDVDVSYDVRSGVSALFKCLCQHQGVPDQGDGGEVRDEPEGGDQALPQGAVCHHPQECLQANHQVGDH